MPPKGKKQDAASKKADQKKKEKIIEDKTFGLKNKKGAKQQKFVSQVTNQVKYGNQSAKKMDQLQDPSKKKKEDKKDKLDELNLLFRPVMAQQKVSKGADPKSVVCAFFKQGQCKKGDKCKFSHDLSKERKGEKRNIYENEAEDTMDNWDEAKLEEVVNKKHGEANKKITNQTTIICKYFLDAVENSKYGWFWECQNGANCKYRHALPPGFVLKKDQKKEEKAEQVSIEELVEKERAGLGANVTKVTLESFLKWKERKKKEKLAKAASEKDKKKNDFKAGKAYGLSGRDLFEFNPDLVTGDDEGADDVVYKREESDEEAEGEENEKYKGPVKEIDLDSIARLASEVDGSGTVAKDDRLQDTGAGGDEKDESKKLSEAAALPPDPEKQTKDAIDAAMAATVNGELLAEDVPIDEDLFEGEDLDELEEDLDTLELDD